MKSGELSLRLATLRGPRNQIEQESLNGQRCHLCNKKRIPGINGNQRHFRPFDVNSMNDFDRHLGKLIKSRQSLLTRHTYDFKKLFQLERFVYRRFVTLFRLGHQFCLLGLFSVALKSTICAPSIRSRKRATESS